MTRIFRNLTPAGPKLSDALKFLRESAGLKVATIGSLFRRSEDTAYRMLDGDWDDLFADINHALAAASPEARDAMKSVLLANVPGADGVDEELSTDINGDGRVDTRDGVEAAMVNTRESMAILGQLVSAEGESRRLYSGERATAIIAQVDRQMRELQRMKALVNQLTARRAS